MRLPRARKVSALRSPLAICCMGLAVETLGLVSSDLVSIFVGFCDADAIDKNRPARRDELLIYRFASLRFVDGAFQWCHDGEFYVPSLLPAVELFLIIGEARPLSPCNS